MIPQKNNLKAYYKLNGAKGGIIARGDGDSTFINTGISVDDTVIFEVRGKYNEISDDQRHGSLYENANNRFYFGIDSGEEWNVSWGNSGHIYGLGISDLSVHTFRLEASGFYIDESLIHDFSSNTFQATSQTIRIFTGLNSSNFSNFDLMYAKIWKSGELVYHYEPSISTDTNIVNGDAIIETDVEITRRDVKDFSGNGNHGTDRGATPVYIESQYGVQMQEFGNTTDVLCNGTETCDPNNGATYAIQVRVDEIVAGRTWFAKNSSSESSLVLDSSSGVIRVFGYAVSGGPKIINLNNTDDMIGQTVNFIITMSIDDLSLYINGEYYDSIDNGGAGWKFNDTIPYTIGSRYTSGHSGEPEGNVLIYDTILTPTEIKQLNTFMNTPPKEVDPTALVVDSDGTGSYISTGIVPSVDTDVELVISYNTDDPADERNGTASPYYWMGASGNGAFQYGFGTAYTSLEQVVKDRIYTLAIRADGIDSCDFLLDGEILGSRSGKTLSGSRTFNLFARDSTNLVNGKIHQCKIWQSGVLVRDMVPTTDGRFYDQVNGTYYSNDGTGTLVTKRIPYYDVNSLEFSTRDGVKDLSNKYTLTNNNAIIGNGMVFDGSSIISTNAPNKSVFTIASTINPNDLVGSQTVIAYNLTSTPQVRLEDGGKIKLLSSSTAAVGKSVSSIIAERLSRIVVTYSSEGELVFYINGVESGRSINLVTFASGDAMFIGSRNGIETFTGLIDNVEVYSEVKSADWVKQDYEKEVKYW